MNAGADRINDMKAWLEAASGWEPGKLTDIFVLPSRGMSKSIMSQLMAPAQLGRKGYIGTTTNAIVTDGLDDGRLTVDKLRGAMETIERPAIWFDDWPQFREIPRTELVGDRWIYLGDVRAEFKNADYPEANTFLVLEKLSKKDPRHPNPAAGDQKHWFILQGHKKVQVRNRTQGELRAKAMHEQAICDTIKRREEAAHRERLAAEEAERVAALNAAQLRALPAFGGF